MNLMVAWLAVQRDSRGAEAGTSRERFESPCHTLVPDTSSACCWNSAVWFCQGNAQVSAAVSLSVWSEAPGPLAAAWCAGSCGLRRGLRRGVVPCAGDRGRRCATGAGRVQPGWPPALLLRAPAQSRPLSPSLHTSPGLWSLQERWGGG